MARWKARVEFLWSAIELLFLSLTVEALQGKTCQNSLLSGGGRSLGAKILEGRGRPWGIFFGFYKTRHKLILLSDSANCTVPCYVPSFWHNTSVWQTDGQTDGIPIAGTALALRALRRAVEKDIHCGHTEKPTKWSNARTWSSQVERRREKMHLHMNNVQPFACDVIWRSVCVSLIWYSSFPESRSMWRRNLLLLRQWTCAIRHITSEFSIS